MVRGKRTVICKLYARLCLQTGFRRFGQHPQGKFIVQLEIMMDRGTVKKTENGFAYIEMELNASCRSCSNKGVCIAGDKPARLKIENSIGLIENDIVEIDLPPQTKLSAGFLLFILPLLMMFAGYYIAFSISSEDRAGMTGAVIGLVIGVITVIVINRIISKTKYFKPRSIRKVD